MDRYLSRDELLQIPQQLMPMPVLADNLRNIVSAAIKIHTSGAYGHMMWLIAPGTLASMQTNGYKRVKLESFLDGDRLKLWWCPDWSDKQRKAILDAINKELKKNWWQGNRYDFISYIGQLTGLKWIQSPFANVDVCSDKGKYISLVDHDYNLVNPDPEQVNKWLENHQPKYQVYGRYTPD
jgi:hypothetical protein